MKGIKLLLLVFIMMTHIWGYGQGTDGELPNGKTVSNTMEGWLGAYTKYRVGKKLYYYGEYHYRRRNNLRDMGQIYIRLGMTYLLRNNLEVTAGVVTPFYWAPNSLDGEIDEVVPQFRLWQQALFVHPVGKAKIYHQIRLEQRWRRDFEVQSPFLLTYRFRYKISTYIPLNNNRLISNTLFLSAYEEIFIQAGKSIVFNHFEDNRLFLGLGYIFNEKIQIQTGYMWTFRHNNSPFEYENRHIPRISLYHSLDFYRGRKQQSGKNRATILQDEF